MTDQITDPLVEVHAAALAGMKRGPKNLARSVAFYREDMAPDADLSEEEFREALPAYHQDDALLRLWRVQLTEWDFTKSAQWTDTEPRTRERRNFVHELLGLAPETREALDTLVPVSILNDEVVISRETPTLWDASSRGGHRWYWEKYKNYLAEQKRWEADSVASLESAAESVVERLADPTQELPYQSRGLVVGYVQSGKTANFTGVIAKALDGGYRLVIVLGGSINLLRAQTQRRIDKELVGRENLLRSVQSEIDSDYATESDWLEGKFLRHGGSPSELGAFDIIRLTTKEDDYKALQAGIDALEIDKKDRNSPLYHPSNLYASNARLMVVKKNNDVLKKLVSDLKRVNRPLLQQLPVLIIDDESDEASVNTTDLKKPNTKRTAINSWISELLRILPRAQYVGYTATPFANVFVDPGDTADIFPSDFIIALDRPHGYMGARDFHDFDLDPDEERAWSNSHELCHVRDIRNLDEDGEGDEDELRAAIDMFVLTAAVKLYREDKGGLGHGYYRHHTMLVHESRLNADHRALHARIRRLWLTSQYLGEQGNNRLKKLFEDDLRPVSAERADGFPVPGSFEELAPYIGTAWQNIGADDRPVIVINGDKENEYRDADFDGTRIWKMLIGGQKLSRGFTVEGLTVSYYRRRASNASTLMQMGRWFGFRKGYRDLVRLYIGRTEESRGQEVDLYKAFEAICQDEEDFRQQLKKYSVMVGQKPQITPAQIPPLVFQRLPWLKPTSRNKMYNTRLVSQGTPGRLEDPTAYPVTAGKLRHNTTQWLPVIRSLSPGTTTFTHPHNGRLVQVDALTTIIEPKDFLEIVRSLKWQGDRFESHLQYLDEVTEAGDQLDDWLVVAPQHRTNVRRARLAEADRTLSWFSRVRRRDPLFGAIGEPKHRPIARRIASGETTGHEDPVTESLVRPRRGVVILYPVVEQAKVDETIVDGMFDTGRLVTAFDFATPLTARGSGDALVRFTTIDSSQGDDAMVDAGANAVRD
ncbi:endonuclease [Streptomyces diacarni]|uniref:Endonuclease n=1 Tax=Streptomyces diacarni TaxID=2800381 RepID=A0A367EZN1_9ACTN|nr:Z1 domain-containing protein [Streptomyces diacarni]RCG23578.1 endonuclease [Streptomyces diacarni]